MAEAQSYTSKNEHRDASASEPKNTSVRSSRFKYYIHDRLEACRLQLMGELTAGDLPELKGCWRTAKTTLGSRKLILDLRDLTSIDEAGKDWVSQMAEQGAAYLPSSSPDVILPKNGAAAAQASYAPQREYTARARRFSRLSGILRNLRLASTESSTQAQ